MSVHLANLLFPDPNHPEKSPLYLRGETSAAVTGDGLHIKAGNTVQFNTYFNALFYSKYLIYTSVNEVTVSLITSGTAKIRVMCASESGEAREIWTSDISGKQVETSFRNCDLSALPEGGMLYLELTAGPDDIVLHSGWYETDTAPDDTVHVAAVICTYHREDYVRRNLERMERAIWDDPKSPIRDQFHVFVIDNGQTLTMPDTDHIRLIPNKNYGGSGGFTRGLIEAYERGYTHALFMDDDIYFEPEVILRTVQILKVAKQMDRPLCIGGQMLIEDDPLVQFESGAFYENGYLRAVGQGLNLSEPQNLLTNNQEFHVQYNAWWYCCIPTSVVDHIGLPLPLFIKTDDVEYGLRIKPHVLLMNGIGIWHMAFAQKYSSHLEYYIKRNELIVSAIHHNGDGVCRSAWKLIRSSGKALIKRDTARLHFAISGYRDFLKGPEYFLNIESDILNGALLREKNEMEQGAIKPLSDWIQLITLFFRLLIYYGRVKQEYIQKINKSILKSYWTLHLK